MKNEKLRNFIFIFLIPMVAGCSPAAGDFVFVGAGEPVLYGISSLHGRAVVESRAGKTLLIESADLVFRYKNRELATGRLIRPMEIPAKESSNVRYDIAVSPASLSAIQTLLSRMELNPRQVFVDAKVRVRYGNTRRSVEIKDVPYSDIIANFDTGKIRLP